MTASTFIFSSQENLNVDDILLKKDLDYMSKHLLGLSYDELRTLIYPTPRYKQFSINKKNGNLRIISAPSFKLKKLQISLAHYLVQSQGVVNKSVHGFTQKRSIVTNAEAHCEQKPKHILNIDIKDFFSSITFYRVRGLFQRSPFNFSYQLSTVLAHLCCYENKLPQGAPTSPIISNLICRRLDSDLIFLAKKSRAIYTRYCDDISISFTNSTTNHIPKEICQLKDSEVHLGNELLQIFNKNSFEINPRKTRLISINHRLEVTGLTINKFPNVKRSFIDEIRGALHAWEKYGLEKANAQWQQKPNNRQLKSGKKPPLYKFLKGKLLYLKMVRGNGDFLYSKLAERFNSLAVSSSIDEKFNLKVDPIVRSRDDILNAVFLVEWTFNYGGEVTIIEGTAFLYKNKLITCAHLFRINDEMVIMDNVQDSKFLAICFPKIKNQIQRKEYEVRLDKSDIDRDIAILTFDDKPPFQPKYFNSTRDSITTGKKVMLVGFPNYSPGKKAPNFFETEVLSTFHLGAMNRIEIKELIRKGNSGGPLLDASLNIVGIAQQGATQDRGNNECLCVKELDKWLGEILTHPT